MDKRIVGMLLASSFFIAAMFSFVHAGDNVQEAFLLQELQSSRSVKSKVAVYLRLAKTYIEQNDFNKCREVCSDALGLNPKRKFKQKIYGVLGDASLKEKNYVKAIEAYQESIMLAPDHIGTRLLLTEAFLKSELNELAEQECLKILELDSKSFEANSILGDLYHKKGFIDKALACYKNAISVRYDASAYRKAAGALEVLGDLPFAISMIKSAIALDQEYDDYLTASRLYEKSLRFKEADAMLRSAILNDPGRIDAHIALGILFLGQQKLDIARKAFKSACKNSPKSAIAHFFLAYTAYQQDDLKTARSEARKAYDYSDGKILKHYSSVLKKLLS